MVTAAALALERMMLTAAYRRASISGFPADDEMSRRVSCVLNEYLEDTTVDHLAFMAVHALVAAAKALKLEDGR